MSFCKVRYLGECSCELQEPQEPLREEERVQIFQGFALILQCGDQSGTGCWYLSVLTPERVVLGLFRRLSFVLLCRNQSWRDLCWGAETRDKPMRARFAEH